MDNDRVFVTYALALMTGIAAVIATLVLVGVATPPSAGVFLEHLALGLTIRGAYKSFGGFDWIQSAAEFAGVITDEAAAEFAGVITDEATAPPVSGAAAMG